MAPVSFIEPTIIPLTEQHVNSLFEVSVRDKHTRDVYLGIIQMHGSDLTFSKSISHLWLYTCPFVFSKAVGYKDQTEKVQENSRKAGNNFAPF